jgi:hypothetical protein
VAELARNGFRVVPVDCVARQAMPAAPPLGPRLGAADLPEAQARLELPAQSPGMDLAVMVMRPARQVLALQGRGRRRAAVAPARLLPQSLWLVVSGLAQHRSTSISQPVGQRPARARARTAARVLLLVDQELI